jgi:hypothetical protein
MCIDWQAAGAIFTGLAAFVALLPIFMASAARKAKARNLRMRVAVKLTKLRPTINALANPTQNDPITDFALLSNDDLARTFSELESLLKESEALSPAEQDRLSQVIANLELALPKIYSKELSLSGIKSIIILIDNAVGSLEKSGLLAGKPYKPWDKP